MKQFSMFDEQVAISGLKYIPEYILPDLERELTDLIDSMPWSSELKRKVQHYGYKYDYTKKSIDPSYYLGKIPDWLDSLCNNLLNDGIFNERPDQVIINEYMPGQGIAAHIDCLSCFSDTICSLSLGSGCIMDLTSNDIKNSIYLEIRSLLVLKDEARYKWRHGITPRKSDNEVKRQRRISLTFRKVIL